MKFMGGMEINLGENGLVAMEIVLLIIVIAMVGSALYARHKKQKAIALVLAVLSGLLAMYIAWIVVTDFMIMTAPSQTTCVSKGRVICD